jgi:predicted ATP-grasp superfamily ATP-dependent carboligase
VAKILVLDGDSAAALAITRSAGRAGHWVAVGAPQNVFTAATLSRYCRERLEYPSSTEAIEGFIAAVLGFARERAIDLIVPVTDRTLGPLSEYREQFAGICRLVMPSHAALQFASDKYRTIELAQSMGISVPKTTLVQLGQKLPQSMIFQFLVVKDRFSIRWVDKKIDESTDNKIDKKAELGRIAYTSSSEEAQSKIDERIDAAGDVLTQEFVAGVGVGFSCFVIGGKACLPFQWERVREVDPRGSASSARKSIPLDKQIASLSQQLLIRMNFEGIAMVEYKRTSDGKFMLMEVNGRPWGSIGLPIACGIDYPRYVIDWVISGTLPPESISYRENVLCRRIVGEMTHLANIRAGKPATWHGAYPTFWKSFFQMALPWRPGVCYDDLWLSDLKPGLAGIRNWFESRRKKI